jgi:hypothetical protein
MRAEPIHQHQFAIVIDPGHEPILLALDVRGDQITQWVGTIEGTNNIEERSLVCH